MSNVKHADGEGVYLTVTVVMSRVRKQASLMYDCKKRCVITSTL